jgi:hypothetical protein
MRSARQTACIEVKKKKYMRNFGRNSLMKENNLGAKWGWLVNATPRPLYPEKDPVSIV